MKNKKNIAMRCNQEQFEAIKPKLNGKIRINSVSVTKFNEYNYLVNCDQKMISNVSKDGFKHVWKIVEEIREEWNEKIFLEACEFEIEPKFEITKEQILTIHEKTSVSNQEELKEWFPEVFKPVLEAGKWYKDIDGSNFLVFVTKAHGGMNTNNSIEGYGFNRDGVFKKWNTNNLAGSNNIRLATTEEVTEALKNEAVRMGFVEGNYFKGMSNGSVIQCKGEIGLIPDCYTIDSMKGKTVLEIGYKDIFRDGIWAEIIPTKTKEEAEKLLNCKIVS